MSESPKSPNSKGGIEGLLLNPLELPDGNGFASVAARLTIREMIALSERYLPIINSQPDFKEKKKGKAFNEPFVL